MLGVGGESLGWAAGRQGEVMGMERVELQLDNKVSAQYIWCRD